MSITMDNCASEEIVYAGEYLNSDSECQSTSGSSNQSVTIPTGRCGMKILSSAVGIQYMTDIFVWKGQYFGSGSSSVTRGEWVQIPVICTLPASSNLTGSFLPEAPITGGNVQNEVAIEGMGTFVFSFEFYRTRSFASVYNPADYPVEVSINDDLYFALQAVGQGDLTLFTEDCVALSTETITPTTLQYPFITDGCLEDPTMQQYPTNNPLEDRFSIQAFQFADKLLVSREDAEVFIQCTVLLCDLSNTTRCFQGCLSSSTRRKRSIAKQDPIVRANMARNGLQSRAARADDDDDDDKVAITSNQSPPQRISNGLTLIDGGNGSQRAATSLAWMSLLLGTVIFHNFE